MLPLLLFLTLFALSHSTLTIVTSTTLYSIPYNVANFGLIPYGKVISGQIIAANPMTNCQIQDDIADDNEESKVDRFLLILRGDCPFVTKVRNAQAELAKVAVIMDNTKSSQGYNGIVMSADGNSRDIQIPSVFISEDDGNKILESIMNNTNSKTNSTVKIAITFPTSKTERPEMLLFFDSNNRGSYIFARQFYKYMKNNMQTIKLTIYHNFYNCFGSLCNQNDCYPGTTICAFPPPVGKGLDIIHQSFRQRLAIQLSPQKGLEYLSLIDDHCIDYSNMQQCSDRQLAKVGINKQSISSQLSNETKIKQYLQSSLKMKQSNHIIFYPDVLINNVTYYGQLSGLDVFEMVCNSFQSPIKECNPYVYDYVPPKKGGLNGWAIMGIVVSSLLVFFVVMICICRRFLRRRISREVNNEINQLVSHYITDFETKRIEGIKETNGSEVEKKPASEIN